MAPKTPAKNDVGRHQSQVHKAFADRAGHAGAKRER